MKFITIILYVLLTYKAMANFLPPNDFLIKRGHKAADSLIFQTYSQMAQEINSLYAARMAEEGAELNFEIEVSNSKVNAFARREEGAMKQWKIIFTAGMLRHNSMTPTVFSGIYCHELGHHLGGSPFRSNGHWASAEGQADYFASNDCLKNILLNSKLLKLSKAPVTDFIKEKCSTIFQSQERLEVCYQSSIVITKVAAFLSRLGGRRGRRLPKPSITKRDQSTAYSTIYKYPSRQCRVDTFFEGALCSEYFYGEDSNCPSSSEAYQGARPKCWFRITSE